MTRAPIRRHIRVWEDLYGSMLDQVLTKTVIKGRPVYRLEPSGTLVPPDIAEMAVLAGRLDARDPGLFGITTAQTWVFRRAA